MLDGVWQPTILEESRWTVTSTVFGCITKFSAAAENPYFGCMAGAAAAKIGSLSSPTCQPGSTSSDQTCGVTERLRVLRGRILSGSRLATYSRCSIDLVLSALRRLA